MDLPRKILLQLEPFKERNVVMTQALSSKSVLQGLAPQSVRREINKIQCLVCQSREAEGYDPRQSAIRLIDVWLTQGLSDRVYVIDHFLSNPKAFDFSTPESVSLVTDEVIPVITELAQTVRVLDTPEAVGIWHILRGKVITWLLLVAREPGVATQTINMVCMEKLDRLIPPR